MAPVSHQSAICSAATAAAQDRTGCAAPAAGSGYGVAPALLQSILLIRTIHPPFSLSHTQTERKGKGEKDPMYREIRLQSALLRFSCTAGRWWQAREQEAVASTGDTTPLVTRAAFSLISLTRTQAPATQPLRSIPHQDD